MTLGTTGDCWIRIYLLGPIFFMGSMVYANAPVDHSKKIEKPAVHGDKAEKAGGKKAPDEHAVHADPQKDVPAETPASLLRTLRQNIDYQTWEFTRELVERIVVETPLNSPESAGAFLAAARYAAKHDKHGEAILFFERWRQLQIDEANLPQVLLELGREHREVGDIRSALDSFYGAMRQIRQQDPKSEVIKFSQWEVAETAYRLHQWERARRLFEMFVDSNSHEDPLVQAGFYRMGDCSRLAGQSGQMVVDYQRALTHSPTHQSAPEARVSLLEYFLKKEEYNLAFKNLNELTALVDTLSMADAKIWKQRSGEVLFQYMFQQPTPQTSLNILASLEKLSTSPSWQDQISYWKGLVHLKEGQWNEAQKSFASKAKEEKTDAAVKEAKKETGSSEVAASKAQYTTLCDWIVSTNKKLDALQLPVPQ